MKQKPAGIDPAGFEIKKAEEDGLEAALKGSGGFGTHPLEQVFKDSFLAVLI